MKSCLLDMTWFGNHEHTESVVTLLKTGTKNGHERNRDYLGRRGTAEGLKRSLG